MTIDPQIVSTKMAGPDDLMAQEAAYLAALPKTATYVIDGDQLTLRDARGRRGRAVHGQVAPARHSRRATRWPPLGAATGVSRV